MNNVFYITLAQAYRANFSAHDEELNSIVHAAAKQVGDDVVINALCKTVAYNDKNVNVA